MNVIEAAAATVRNAAGGLEAVAEAIAVRPTVLRNKLNPASTSHFLTLAEAVRVMKVTGDVRVIHALADEFGGVYVPLPEAGVPQTANVLADVSAMSAEFGDLIREVSLDISDGEISANELKRISAEASQLRDALARLMADLTAMHEASRPEAARD